MTQSPSANPLQSVIRSASLLPARTGADIRERRTVLQQEIRLMLGWRR